MGVCNIKAIKQQKYQYLEITQVTLNFSMHPSLVFTENDNFLSKVDIHFLTH